MTDRARSGSDEGLTILLVEDDQENRMKLARTFVGRGWDVRFAGDGQQAVSLGLRVLPGVFLLKVPLPAGGGMSALERLRMNIHTTSIPVVGLVKPPREGDEMLAAGANRVLSWPADPEAACRAIEEATGAPVEVNGPPAAALRDPDRLQAIEETGLLDADPGEELDALLRIAARLLDVPVAMLTVVDEDRQYVVDHVEREERWSNAREVPLSHSFCQWVVAGDEPLMVNDAREHRALRSNPAVDDLGVVAYAGVPMTAPSGDRIGAFCGIDDEPREWTERDHAVLRDLRDVVGGLIAMRENGRPTPWDPPDVVETLARAVGGATRLMRREGAHLRSDDRERVLDILDRQVERLDRLIRERRVFGAGS